MRYFVLDAVDRDFGNGGHHALSAVTNSGRHVETWQTFSIASLNLTGFRIKQVDLVCLRRGDANQ
jgi:hypothetical protein